MHRRGRKKVRGGKKIDVIDVRYADKVYQFEARIVGTVLEPEFSVYCDQFGIEVQNESLKAAIAEAYEKLRGSVEAEWEHVLVVVIEHEAYCHLTPKSGDNHGQGFVVSFGEYWIMRQNGKYIGFNQKGPRHKVDTSDNEIKSGDIKNDFFTRSPGARLVLPYSEELEARLSAFKDKVEDMYHSIHRLMLDGGDFVRLLEGTAPKGSMAAALMPDRNEIAKVIESIAKKKSKKVSGKKTLKKRGAGTKRR